MNDKIMLEILKLKIKVVLRRMGRIMRNLLASCILIVGLVQDSRFLFVIGLSITITDALFQTTFEEKKFKKYLTYIRHNNGTELCIRYNCDGQKCKKCSNECRHTTDITHAKNFDYIDDYYTEK